MVARILIPVILAIAFSCLYFDMRYWRHFHGRHIWRRILRWLPGVGMAIFTVGMASTRNFIPDDISLTVAYVFLLGVIVAPLAGAALLSAVGWAVCRLRHKRRNWGNLVAFFFVVCCWAVTVYGFTAGVKKLEVKHVDVYLEHLPDTFDGYRIVHFSDAHVGSFTGWRRPLLERVIDSIGAQRPDLIAFTGDLMNLQPSELYPVQELLSSLKARDGVVSVLGNHDYSEYIDDDPAVEKANCREIIAREKQWGWTVLLNEHLVLRRGSDSIVVAGEQNLEKPDSADYQRTMQGVGRDVAVIMLQHNPLAWDEYVRPDGRVGLMLSGHTHGGQAALFGISGSMLKYKQDYGLYHDRHQWLYVTSGVGALLPFRIGRPAEIAVITLHKKEQ